MPTTQPGWLVIKPRSRSQQQGILPLSFVKPIERHTTAELCEANWKIHLSHCRTDYKIINVRLSHSSTAYKKVQKLLQGIRVKFNNDTNVFLFYFYASSQHIILTDNTWWWETWWTSSTQNNPVMYTAEGSNAFFHLWINTNIQTHLRCSNLQENSSRHFTNKWLSAYMV